MNLFDARVEALTVSTVNLSTQLTKQDLTKVIADAVRLYGGVRGCAAEMAQRYGDNDMATTARRVTQCRVIIAAAFTRPTARTS